MKNVLKKWTEKWRKKLLERGYACDGCGAELFDYPSRRLCVSCEEKLPKIGKPCPKCGRQLQAEGLCLNCKAQPPKFTRGFSYLQYKGDGAVLVNRMKNGRPRLAAYLGEKMGEVILPYLLKDERVLIVAVPLFEKRRKERGYNQAERLAESVLAYLCKQGIDAEADFSLLQKRRETGAQKKMSRRERAENLKGAFHIAKRKACEGRSILLVDDIMTTGATASECAARLLGAGAKRVVFLSAAALSEEK